MDYWLDVHIYLGKGVSITGMPSVLAPPPREILLLQPASCKPASLESWTVPVKNGKVVEGCREALIGWLGPNSCASQASHGARLDSNATSTLVPRPPENVSRTSERAGGALRSDLNFRGFDEKDLRG